MNQREERRSAKASSWFSGIMLIGASAFDDSKSDLWAFCLLVDFFGFWAQQNLVDQTTSLFYSSDKTWAKKKLIKSN